MADLLGLGRSVLALLLLSPKTPQPWNRHDETQKEVEMESAEEKNKNATGTLPQKNEALPSHRLAIIGGSLLLRLKGCLDAAKSINRPSSALIESWAGASLPCLGNCVSSSMEALQQGSSATCLLADGQLRPSPGGPR